jgi:hypothetical protein
LKKTSKKNYGIFVAFENYEIYIIIVHKVYCNIAMLMFIDCLYGTTTELNSGDGTAWTAKL